MQSLHDRVATDAGPKGLRRRIGMTFGSTGRSILALLPYAVLGGLLVWGHSTGWTLPAYSSIRGAAAPAAEDWCPEHRVPESLCVECRPGLLPRLKAHGWCETHGVHECPLCHPEVAQLDKPPAVTAADLAQAERALALTPRQENGEKCRLPKRRIQFASQEAAEKVGVKTEPVWTGPVTEAVQANGEVAYDQTRTARLSSRAPGTVFRVFKQVGDPVEQGEVVALIDAAEVGRVKAGLLQALVQFRLKSRLVESLRTAGGASPAWSVTEAESALAESRIRVSTAQQMLTNLGIPFDAKALSAVPDADLPDRLRFLGLPESVTSTLDRPTSSGNLLPLVSALSGTLVTRNIVAGEVVDTTHVLFTVVDTRTMWLTLDLRLEDMKLVALSQEVRFRSDGAPEPASGRISWLSSEADHATRTVKVRATLDNAKGGLRSNTFGSGRIILREEPRAVVISSAAVQWEGTCHVVFVRDRNYLKADAPKVFHTRTVRIGAKDDQQTEIIAGLLKGEVVVTEGSAALRSELLRNNLGAGCDCCNK